MITVEDALREPYTRFPPKWRHVLVPTGPPRATAAGTTLYTASRAAPLAAQRVLWALARVGGARLLPGTKERWQPPVDDDALHELWSAWTSVTGPVEGVAVYRRVQADRPGVVLLMCGRRSSMLVRLRDDPGQLELERRISDLALEVRPRTFRVPRLLGVGAVDRWSWSGYEVMARAPHAPVRRLAAGTTDEVAALVERAVPRPHGVPEWWCGAHGDLTPWNVRRAGRTTWLIDWEDAGWAPPGADEVYFAATSAAMSRRTPTAPLGVDPGHEEARSYWAGRVAQRAATAQETHLHEGLTTLLSREV